ncbi:MAG: hypothetical protein WDM88_05215 [Galbitalea sp.]
MSGTYNQLSEQAVDGVVIIFEAHLLDDAEFTLPPGLPVVVIDSNAGSEYTVVDTDQAEGARLATEHLLQLGHRQVWHIAGPGRILFRRAPRGIVAAHAARRGHHPARGAPRRLDDGVGIPPRPHARPARRRHGHLRGERPDGAPARCAPCTNSGGTSRATSAWWGSTTWKRRTRSGRR